MSAIAQEDFTNNLFVLLKETFESPRPQMASCYLDQGAGLFETLDNMTAEVASRSVTPGAPTIAAHCAHVRFYIIALERFIHGNLDQVDWKQSWLVQTVNPSEWDNLKEELRRAYTTITETLLSIESWGDEPVGGAMAILVHTAYHLGAIRQLTRTFAAADS
jgi:hypothetical protein